MNEKTSDKIAKVSLIIISIALAIVCVIGVTLVSNSLFGNPVSKKLAKNTALEYIEENFSDDYYIEDVWYDEKYENYVVHVLSSADKEVNFTIYFNHKGELLLIEHW